MGWRVAQEVGSNIGNRAVLPALLAIGLPLLGWSSPMARSFWQSTPVAYATYTKKGSTTMLSEFSRLRCSFAVWHGPSREARESDVMAQAQAVWRVYWRKAHSLSRLLCSAGQDYSFRD